jgi:uroporphyrinogen-III synthase
MVEGDDQKGKKFFAITRDDSSSLEFRNAMESYGWTVICLKTIVVIPKPRFEIERIVSNIIWSSYDTCIFLSGKAVDIMVGHAESSGVRLALLSKLSSIRTICIGPSTKEKLSYYGIASAIMPETYNSGGLVSYLSRESGGDCPISRIVIPRSQLGGSTIARSLSKRGYHVDQFYLYDVRANSEVDEGWSYFFNLLRDRKISAIGFTSASSVRAFFEIIRRELGMKELSYIRQMKRLVSIGHMTTAELKKNAPGPFIEAAEHTLNGIVEVSKAFGEN